MRLCIAIVLCASAPSGAALAQEHATTSYFVSLSGDDRAPGTQDKPFRTLKRAQAALRSANQDHDVVVTVMDGVYRLDAPLVLTAMDGGLNGHSVTWKAADNAHPVISGGVAVDGWTLADRARNLYVASVPKGVDSRQLWVDGRLAKRAAIEIPRSAVTFTDAALEINDPAYDYLAKLPDQRRVEVEGLGYFTDRFAPVERIEGRRLIMQQPAWDNNNWGYDTLNKPYGPEFAHLYLVNSLAFLTQPDQWYLDPAAGKLYYRPRPGTDMAKVRVELPRLPYLISISGSYDRPVRDISFSGFRFSHTSWMGPSTREGYANQQSGAFLAGVSRSRPVDALKSCSWGCPGFEMRRNEWSQIPAAIQVSAAQRIKFEHNVFAHLGQVALGIGNNPDANASGTGYGAQAIEVSGNVFTDIAAGAILVGGVRREAHHPASEGQTNRQVMIRNNRISKVSQDYRDNSAVLSTYVDRALILHNDISDAPYDGIDIGWGWGLNDPGGNPSYRTRQRGYYDYAPNLVYHEPTTHRDVIVAYNRIHDAKQHFEDGGAIYNLSASPGTVIAENYVYDIPKKIALYLDEGSRYVTVRNNVVDGAAKWLNVNTVRGSFPERISPDNTATGNWHNTTEIGGMWDAYQNNLIVDDHLVKGTAWPAEARKVMDASGIEPKAGTPSYDPATGAVK
ncbi:right-handed parallel beta-helix repeat-containing protein [Sphingomonas sp. JC676]|uniref:right-handed parallel beta-helix repeat-containing protein n=1 Tax=Sphingomonas sp. JC676 TaxID=2768065 RepID=UPI00165867CB|nr:right-handed parallel beta-helix repeat-containing protein [Sphingomonas sp. JC676]MBC9035094.1 right-handed parallel beta-helix repeat-containing protein [Sphingomonas sp. JC676]